MREAKFLVKTEIVGISKRHPNDVPAVRNDERTPFREREARTTHRRASSIWIRWAESAGPLGKVEFLDGRTTRRVPSCRRKGDARPSQTAERSAARKSRRSSASAFRAGDERWRRGVRPADGAGDSPSAAASGAAQQGKFCGGVPRRESPEPGPDDDRHSVERCAAGPEGSRPTRTVQVETRSADRRSEQAARTTTAPGRPEAQAEADGAARRGRRSGGKGGLVEGRRHDPSAARRTRNDDEGCVVDPATPVN